MKHTKTPTSTKENVTMHRQGDLLIVAASLPTSTTPDPNPDVVLAYGEVTGHAHRVVAEGARLHRTNDGATYLVLTEPGQVVHEEHGTIGLAPGSYQVIRQRTYEPDAIRLVAD